MSIQRLASNEIIYSVINNDNFEKTENKKYILKIIDKCHDILYNAENIEGENALNDIMNFIFIKSIQFNITDTEEDGK